MRTLNRPMFRMGGPIKQGIMHGIREPHAGGGRAALVGNPIFPKDSSGRAHHAAFFGIPAALSWAGRAAPWAMRGIKSGWSKIKPDMIPRMKITQPSTTVPIGMRGRIQDRITKTPRTNWEMVKGFAQKNPWWTYGGIPYAATTEPGQAIGKAALVGIPKWTAEALTPKSLEKYLPWEVEGIESAWKDEVAEEKPDDKDTPKVKKLTEAEKKLIEDTKLKNAKADRDKRVNNLLEIMGYDKAKKTAAYDALIDAGQTILQRGTLDKKNIGRELIDPIVEQTSKRFDKPEQIREAVGLMMTKGEIEKDIAKGKGSQLKANARDLVAAGVFKTEKAALDHLAKVPDFEDTVMAVYSKTGAVDGNLLSSALKSSGEGIPIREFSTEDKSWKEFANNNKAVPDVEIKFIESISDRKPGYYIVGDRAVKVNEDLTVEYKW